MSDRTKHDSVRKHLTMLGIAMACACVLLICSSFMSLHELQRLTASTASSAMSQYAMGLRRLQYTALLSLVVLAASATHAAAVIRRELQSPLARTPVGGPTHDAAEDTTARTGVELLQAIADALPMRVAYLDLKQRFTFINRNGCERHGRTRAELVGRPASEFVTALRTRNGIGLLQAAYTGQAQRFEHDDEFNGRRLRLETHVKPDFDSHGRVCGLFVIGVDITALKEVERELRDLTDVFESTPDYVAQADSLGQVKYLNPAARAAVGIARDESLQGRSYREFYTAETIERFAKEIVPAVHRSGVWVGETSVVLQGGSVSPVNHMVIAHRNAQGRIARYSSLMRDISADMCSRRALSQQTATLNAVIESIPAMVAVVDPQLRYRLVNHAYERWQGQVRPDMVGHSMQRSMASAQFASSLPYVQRALAGETVAYELHNPAAVEIRHVAMTLVPLRLEDGSSAGFISVAYDITKQRDEKDQLLLLSERDSLTGLLNRAGFEKYLVQKVQQGEGGTCGLLYIDLDHFKSINDSHGHAAGDEVLREFATRLRRAVRPSDAVARLGGDEFAVVLAGLREPEDGARVARKLVELARMPFIVGEQALLLSASVGVAFNAVTEGGWTGLVQRADTLLYEAKAAGRARLASESLAPRALG
jgi:diguanylate cyclase (GGDEF)-like protein/PAS domain S-box-containing protein